MAISPCSRAKNPGGAGRVVQKELLFHSKNRHLGSGVGGGGVVKKQINVFPPQGGPDSRLGLEWNTIGVSGRKDGGLGIQIIITESKGGVLAKTGMKIRKHRRGGGQGGHPRHQGGGIGIKSADTDQIIRERSSRAGGEAGGGG